ncbi:MAG: neutral zinc metallopeptidase [Hyphomonadaceae bacterium]
MRLDDQRRSQNVEYRTGSGGRGGGGGFGGLPFRIRGLGIGGIIVIGLILFLMPANLRNMILGQVLGGGGSSLTESAGTTEASSSCPQGQEQSCQFFEAVLGSTEDVWRTKFQQGALPNYGRTPQSYTEPRLVVFFGPNVDTACGAASTDVGPFYCPGDSQLYINPSFYQTMAQRLNADGDFAQAYVIAHEVGHHIQNLIGATRFTDQARGTPQENQMSVRLELQADCLAGVWGHTAQGDLAIDEADLREALNAAHQIGDDTLQRNSRGYATESTFTHGSSDQRVRWFRTGFQSGDARQCDTFAVRDFRQL